MIKFLDFWADWCSPCKIMTPIIEELEKELEGKVIFEKIDVDNNPQMSDKYNVLSIPTYVILKDDLEADRTIGATSKQNLLNFINKHLSS